jgi:uncharacterized protein YoxC
MLSKYENFLIALLLGGLTLITILLILYGIDIKQELEMQKRINEQINNLKVEIIDIKKQVNENKKNIENISRKVNNMDKKLNRFNKTIDNISMIIRNVNNSVDNETAHVIAYNIVDASSKYNVPIEYIISVMWVESHFNPHAYNERTGCIGLMQINPDTWLKLKNEDLNILLFNIRTNIMAGAYILKYYHDKYGNWKDAIIAYYGISPYAKKYYIRNVSWRLKWIKEKIKT